jgi:hypothetical protein
MSCGLIDRQVAVEPQHDHRTALSRMLHDQVQDRVSAIDRVHGGVRRPDVADRFGLCLLAVPGPATFIQEGVRQDAVHVGVQVVRRGRAGLVPVQPSDRDPDEIVGVVPVPAEQERRATPLLHPRGDVLPELRLVDLGHAWKTYHGVE